jgi:uncharacterized membrane protein
MLLAGLEIFTRQGGVILSRWFHYLAGITWIGLLYYFNFVQTPAFAEFEAGPRTEAFRKLVPRALWWFRWAAMLTVLTGILILGFQKQFDADYMKSSQGAAISTGILLALIMFSNVWLVIWPNQKILIANAERVAAGGEPDPAAAPAGRKGLLASRTNTFFSIPVIFFMGAASHFSPGSLTAEGGKRALYWVIVIVIAAVAELNALGRLGGYGQDPPRKYLETHKNVIIAGFVLWAVLYLLWDLTF